MNNRLILLCKYKMMHIDWSAWTPDSFYTVLLLLTDEEITSFYMLSEEELEEIEKEIDVFVKEKGIIS